MITTNNSSKIKNVSILDFPKNMFIELPKDYRDILFQLIFLDSKTADNTKKSLKEEGLKKNIFRWRKGYDKDLQQLINLDSLLYLFKGANKAKSKIEKKIEIVEKQLKNSGKRIQKNKVLISLIKDIRYILKGNNNLAKKFNINPNTLIKYIGNKYIKKVPSDFINNLIKFTKDNILYSNYTLEEIQNKIISYKAHHGKAIKPGFKDERKLPIKVTPEFESIIFHLFGDGHIKEIGSGEYTQLSKEGKNNFLNKLYNTFGYFDTSKKSFDDGRVIIPKAIVKILCKHYNLNYKSFNWDTSRLPPNISNDKEFRVAGLAAFIVDEGHISDRGIELYSGNKWLLSQIRDLATSLNLDCSELKSKKAYKNTKESFRFRIRKQSSIKLIQMIRELKEKYPLCGLAQKEKLIK